MAKYSKKAQKTIAKAVRKMKKGNLKSGSGDTVTDQKQAVAIGILKPGKKDLRFPKKNRMENEVSN